MMLLSYSVIQWRVAWSKLASMSWCLTTHCRPSVSGVTTAKRREAENVLHSVINRSALLCSLHTSFNSYHTRVKDKVLSAKAPSTRRLANYSTVKTQLVSQEECRLPLK